MTKVAERARERHQRLRRVEHWVPNLRDHPSERETEPFLDAASPTSRGGSEPP